MTNYKDKARATIAARKKEDRAKLIEELKKIPVIEVAVQRAGLSRATYYRWESEDKAFAAAAAAAMSEGIAFVNDMAESQVIALIKERNWASLAFWLRANHPRYGNKLEVSGHIATVPEALTPEQRDDMKRALRLASLDGAKPPAQKTKNQHHYEKEK
jgi:hypothetical protein